MDRPQTSDRNVSGDMSGDMDVSLSSSDCRKKAEAVPSACVEAFIRRKDTAPGVTGGGVVDLNGAYRARTGDLLLAKHDLHELDDVRHWKNHVPDALRTGRAYDVRAIRAIRPIRPV